MDRLIQDFSVKALADFFKKASPAFVPERESLDYLLDSGTESKEFGPFSELERVGNIAFPDTEELVVIACRHGYDLTDRSSKKKQFAIAKAVLKEDFKDVAIFVFYDDAGRFRFSFIRRNWDGKTDGKCSSWRRFTYFVTPEDTNKTFRQRIGSCAFRDLDSIQEAFSVEKLTKEFYNDLFRWYRRAMLPEAGISFPSSSTEKPEERMIRMITRLLFVWFVKQKDFVPEVLFDAEAMGNVLKDFDPNSATNGSYYNAFLQNLFFATLNREVGERGFASVKTGRDVKNRFRYAEMFALPEDGALKLFEKIPFLNGGLFECLDQEEGTDGRREHLDGFSRSEQETPDGKPKYRAVVPNVLFFDEETGFFPILRRYNFTVEENGPGDVQVALDPELIGNVFENLLGDYNAETRESARKASGSFYTPREIVGYMCDRSLIAYLKNQFPKLDEQLWEDLFRKTDELPDMLREDFGLRLEVSQKLQNAKVLDPACGSGAFTIGILNRMTDILRRLETENADNFYRLKLHLIQNCIYGVDIQPTAVQIAKLRFFIALVLEQDALRPDRPAENYGVVPLPNLETKFVAADTLVGRKNRQARTLFTDESIETVQSELIETRRRHFGARSVGKKRELRARDAELRADLLRLLQQNGDFAPEDAIQFATWNPYDQNASAPFFDPSWMFNAADGFDIIIGNPPYILLRKNGSLLTKKYKQCNYQTIAAIGDVYMLFYERGWQLLKENGVLCYITSKTWMRNNAGEATRRFFLNNVDAKLLIDLPTKVFESASVNTNILLFTKGKYSGTTRICKITNRVDLEKLSEHVSQNAQDSIFDSADGWTVLSDMQRQIKQKVESKGIPLKDWDIQINIGAFTGYNEAFIIDRAKRDELIRQDPRSADVIKPVLRGKDIKRYGYEFKDLYLITTFPSLKIDIEKYPAIKDHLLSFGTERLEQTGATHNINGKTIKARKKTNNKWYETSDRTAFWRNFLKDKIIYSEIVREPQFYLDKTKFFFIDCTAFMMTGENLDYLHHLLNTKAVAYIFKTYYAGGGLGEKGYRYKKVFLERLPIPPKPKNMAIDEENANQIVYQQYGLSADEIAEVEGGL